MRWGDSGATQKSFDLKWYANESNGASFLYADASANLIYTTGVDVQFLDNDYLVFGTGADASGDVNMHWDGTNLIVAAAADDTLIEIGDAAVTQLSFDVRIYGNSASGASYLEWDASADTLQVKGAHMKLNTADDTNTVRLNSRNYAATSGDIIGFQSKPAANADGTETVYGAQISPRFNDAVGGASLVGAQFDPILKGTSGNLSGDVRSVQAQITDENAAGRTVSGTTCALYMWQQLAAHTFTGGVWPLYVVTGGGATPWSGFAKMPADGAVASYSAGHYTPGNCDAKIVVEVGGHTLYVPAYDAIS